MSVEADSSSLAIFHGEDDRILVVGATHRAQETRLFRSQFKLLRRCAAITVYRQSSTARLVPTGGFGIDWRAGVEAGLGVTLLGFLLTGEILLVAKGPVCAAIADGLPIAEVTRIAADMLAKDVLLQERLKREPNLLSHVLAARNLFELNKRLNFA